MYMYNLLFGKNFVKLNQPLSGRSNIFIMMVRGEYVFDCLCFCGNRYLSNKAQAVVEGLKTVGLANFPSVERRALL